MLTEIVQLREDQMDKILVSDYVIDLFVLALGISTFLM
jgi:hypothetical protein